MADENSMVLATADERDAFNAWLKVRESGKGYPADLWEAWQARDRTLMAWTQSLVAALKRLSFAAQTTGGTAGPDAELQAAIANAEQAMSMQGLCRVAAPDANQIRIGKLRAALVAIENGDVDNEQTAHDALEEDDRGR